MRTMSGAIAVGMVLTGAPSFAQAPAPPAMLQLRYQLTQMERVLGGAAEHGARAARERVRTMIPADMLLSDNVRVRGFRMEHYGLFFDIEMPPLEGTLPWVFQTLDQNNLGLESATRELQALVDTAGNNDSRQALQRLLMQVSPSLLSAASPAATGLGAVAPDGSRPASGSAAAMTVDKVGPTALARAGASTLSDPQEAYRMEVREALIEAMLDHSGAVRLTEDEWLTVAARGNEDRPRLMPGDYDSPTIQISVRGADLIAFQARQISREEARRRFVIKEY